MHMRGFAKEDSTQCLGPSVTGEVVMEGVHVNALPDTGSPVTIVSFEGMGWASQKNGADPRRVEEISKGKDPTT